MITFLEKESLKDSSGHVASRMHVFAHRRIVEVSKGGDGGCHITTERLPLVSDAKDWSQSPKRAPTFAELSLPSCAVTEVAIEFM